MSSQESFFFTIGVWQRGTISKGIKGSTRSNRKEKPDERYGHGELMLSRKIELVTGHTSQAFELPAPGDFYA
jgi:hypothetical protein